MMLASKNYVDFLTPQKHGSMVSKYGVVSAVGASPPKHSFS